MKNIEKYEKEISKLVYEDNILPCAIATVAGIRKEKPCYHQECEECHKKCIEWMYSEYKEPVSLLNDKEKRIIRLMVNMIAYFGKETLFVELNKNSSGYFLTVAYKGVNGSFVLCHSPYFDHTKMFTGMKENVEYTLKDLGL